MSEQASLYALIEVYKVQSAMDERRIVALADENERLAAQNAAWTLLAEKLVEKMEGLRELLPDPDTLRVHGGWCPEDDAGPQRCVLYDLADRIDALLSSADAPSKIKKPFVDERLMGTLP